VRNRAPVRIMATSYSRGLRTHGWMI